MFNLASPLLNPTSPKIIFSTSRDIKFPIFLAKIASNHYTKNVYDKM